MKRLIILGCLLATPALAQQHLSNPQEQIERTIGNLFVTNMQLQSQLTNAQAELAKAQARIKELEQKDKPVDGK